MSWVEKTFAELSLLELHGILRLRQRVFVLEQRCTYLDLDGLDLQAHHLWLPRAAAPALTGPVPPPAAPVPPPLDHEPAAYLRILPPGAAYDEVSLGRVVTEPELRGQGLGVTLLREGLARARALHGPVPIRIGAQAHLERLYVSLGFRRVSEDYVEDGIPHLEMLAG